MTRIRRADELKGSTGDEILSNQRSSKKAARRRCFQQDCCCRPRWDDGQSRTELVDGNSSNVCHNYRSESKIDCDDAVVVAFDDDGCRLANPCRLLE